MKTSNKKHNYPKNIIWKQIITLSIFIIAYSSDAQTLNDVARSKELTWYGVDFSEARFINFGSSINAGILKDSLIAAWSLNPLSKSDEQMIQRKYQKESLEVDLSTCERRNAAIDFSDRLVTESFDMDIEMVRKIISEYPISGNDYGILLIAEGFDKIADRAFVWVAFINNHDKKVITARRYAIETTSGIMGNRWTGAIYNVIKQSSNDLRQYK